MRALLVSLLAAALLLGTVHSLKCYSCLQKPSYDQCTMVADCPAGDVFCETYIQKKGQGAILISKTCQGLCTKASDETSSTDCCKTDLCNGATSVRISYTVISLAVGVLLLRAGL